MRSQQPWVAPNEMADRIECDGGTWEDAACQLKITNAQWFIANDYPVHLFKATKKWRIAGPHLCKVSRGAEDAWCEVDMK